MGFSMARADVVSPYTYNFEGLSTSSTDFAPAGWGHVVEGYDGYGDFYYVDYQLKESGGYGDNGAYLYIGSQTIGDGSWDQGTVADMLVTPPITGDASIYVKKNKSSGTITFYTCSYNASTKKYVRGAKYDVTVPELSETEWTKVDIPGVAADTRIGICGDDVSIDEFAAASAVIELRKELNVSLVKLMSGATADADAAGNITLKMNVKVKNNGDVAFNPGDENYSLSIMRKNTGSAADTEVYTQPIAVALQPGETSDFIELNAVIPVTESARSRFDVRENITGSSSYGGWVDIYAYKPDFSVTTTSFDVISNGTLQDFGISQSSVDKEYNIRNTKGAAPLTINSITVPEGFTYSIKDEDVAETLTTPFVVRAHEKLLLTVTMDASVLGSRSGDIVVTPADGQGTAITLPVSGTIVDPSKLYVTFADGKFPAGTYVEGNSWTVDKYTNGDGNYSAVNSSVTPMTKFVLPKIRLGEGESLTFTAAKRGSSSKLNVYYSADRVNWTLAQSISEDASDEANKFSADKYGSSYSYIDVFKYKSFTPAIPAGDWYVAFEAGYSRIGSIVGGTVLAIPEHELLVSSVVMPEEGVVNHAYTASATIANVGTADIAEGELTAKLYFGETAMQTQALPALASGASTSVSFNVPLREAGTVSVYAKFTYASGYVQTEAVNVTIAEEKADAEVIVGEANSTDRAGAIKPYNNYSRTEIIYPKSLINLPAGTKLDAIRFYGYHDAKDFKITLNAWVGNVAEGTALQGFGVDGLTQVATNQIIDMNKTISKTAMEPVVELTFPDGFVYDGGDVRLYLDASATDWVSTLFEVDKNVSGQAQQAASDSELTDSSRKSNISLPVAHFVVSPYKTLSGAVKNEKGEAVASAYIILASADGVEYYSETDAEGAFSMDVIKYGKEYKLTVSHPSYDAYTHPETISLADGDISGLAITLTKTYTFSGVVTDAETHAPIAGVEIYVSNPESGADVMTGTTDEDGVFDLKFKQLGSYDIMFKAAGYDMVSYEGTPFEGNFDITVEMQKTVRTFSGTVTDAESHAAIAGASVALYKGENKVAEATTGADGSFEIKVKDLAVFSLVVKAEGYEDFTFDTIDLTEGDMTDTPIEMTPNSGVGMLTADGLRVYGTVGAVVVESATEATVRVYNAAGSLVRRADVAGKTRIEGLQRGVYIVNGVKVIVK